MTEENAIALYTKVSGAGIDVWVDGGWGVDALLGMQTRPHDDLDIVVQMSDLAALRRLLENDGYVDIERDDTRAWNFVMGTADEHLLVDIHAVVFDEAGNGIYGPPELGEEAYPAGSFSSYGLILGQTVKCIAPEFLVAFHTGYRLGPTDVHDVTRLCERFGIELPPEYHNLAADELTPPHH